jgi:hypothetical protein
MRSLTLLVMFSTAPAAAAVLDADPSNYRKQLDRLAPGDVLRLAPGTYRDRLPIIGKHGDAARPIVIEGPARDNTTGDATAGGTATFIGVRGQNTVDLRDCRFVTVRNITVDCAGLPVDGVNAKGDVPVHDVTIENVVILNAGANQQIVGINTKCPCWNWTIRGCEIIGAGTGMYLGNSNGEAPFIRGVVEYNRVYDPEGYCIEIKHQNAWPAAAPTGAGRTVIRHNVLIKTDRPSGSGDRPNLLFGGFPDVGPGSEDRYEVYGNFVAHNPRESLVQATGRFSIHDNLLVGAKNETSAGIFATAHQRKAVRLAHVYNNTVYGCGRGIRAASGSRIDACIGNLVLGDDPISGDISLKSGNLTASTTEASANVARPSLVLEEMNFAPRPERCRGEALGLDPFHGDADFDRDFAGAPKGDRTFRGCYAGDNPMGWTPANTLKPRVGGGL